MSVPTEAESLEGASHQRQRLRFALPLDERKQHRETMQHAPPASYVFDLDGTISDPAVGIGRSLNYALQHFGYPSIPEREVSRLIGPPLDETFRSIIDDASPHRIAALVSRYRERYAEIGFSENVIYPGIPEALNALVQAGIVLGLCTSKRADFADRILRLFGIREHFRFVSGGDIGISKREQLGALLANQSIDGSFTMIGDRAIDILAARANGLAAIGVLWGHGSLEELRAASPDLLVEFPHELVERARGV
jgi:phosphoglycolate phosphatase